jgi:predicted pyridoxine 5'-phosphate oxidase superfamily flavin-nucleotide-binding protein
MMFLKNQVNHKSLQNQVRRKVNQNLKLIQRKGPKRVNEKMIPKMTIMKAHRPNRVVKNPQIQEDKLLVKNSMAEVVIEQISKVVNQRKKNELLLRSLNLDHTRENHKRKKSTAARKRRKIKVRQVLTT